MADAARAPTVRALLGEATRALALAAGTVGSDGGEIERDAAEHSRGDARAEAELLLAHVLQRDRAWLIAHDDACPDDTARERFRHLVAARAAGRPIAYLVGTRGFWSLTLAVTPAVLIPRPETELLVELALARVPDDVAVDIVDLGTGSGAIALALAHERPRARVLATDASVEALAIAQGNGAALELRNVTFAAGNWWQAVGTRRFTLAVSNPPYIKVGDAHLERGDLRYEPRAALASGTDGLDAIRAIVAGARDHLVRGGSLLFEHGYDQAAASRDLLARQGFIEVFTARDLAGHERVTGGRLGP